MKVKDGRQIAHRREALEWDQIDLAKAVGVSVSSIVRVEGDSPQVSRAMKSAVLRALEEEERRRGLVTGSVIAPGTTEASLKEGADVPLAFLEDLAAKVAAVETLAARTSHEARLVRLELDNRIARRKSG